MADGSFATLVSKNRDDNSQTNPIFIALSDGTDLALIDASGNLETNVNKVIPGTGATNLGKAEDAVHASGDVGVMALAVRQDVQADFGADGDYVPLSIDADGNLRTTASAANIFVDDSAFTVATSSVGATGFLADETAPDSVDEGDIGIARMTLDRKQLMVLADPNTDANRLNIDASGHAQIDLAAVSVTAVPVSKDSSANSETNPIFVKLTDVASANEVHDYNTVSGLAADTASNHDYTVAGTTFFLKRVTGSSSGGMKIEVQTGPVATLATKAVAFIARHGGTEQLVFDPPVEVPSTSTGTVRVIRTNRQGVANDLYTTIIGYDD